MEGLTNILFLDIETVAAQERYEQLDERMKVLWARKASFFRQRDQELDDEGLYLEKAGIYAEFGKVVAIGIGKITEQEGGERALKTRCFSNHDEVQLLLEFKAALEKMDQSTLKLCAHNGKEFDFPYLCRRMLIHGIPLPSVLNVAGRKSWEVPFLDTMEMWKFGDYKHYTSLDLLTALFQIPSSKGDMDGSRVNDVYYSEKDLGKIARYCSGDVVALAQLFLRMRGLPLVPPERITQV